MSYDDPLEHVKKMPKEGGIFVIMLESIDGEKLEVCRTASERGIPMFCAIKRGLDTSAVDGLRWMAKFYFDSTAQIQMMKVMIDAAVMTYQHNKTREAMR